MRRRTWLALGAFSAVALAIGGGTVASFAPGLQDSKLTAAGREVFGAISRGLLDGSLPTDAAARPAAVSALLDRIDALVAGLPPHAQGELSQLLALLASSAGRRALAGVPTPWREADIGEIQAGLQAMRVSGLSLRQQAYQALHDIVGAAYFADASTWRQLGYPGPLEI